MPKATKRERQRQNREIRRQAMMAAEKRRRRMRAARALLIPLVILIVVFVVIQVTRGGDENGDSATAASTTKDCTTSLPTTAARTSFAKAPPVTIDPDRRYWATIDTSEGPITVELDAEQAPETVNSFIFLACRNFYNGTTFHRIVTDFVDQGGDPQGDGTGGPGYSLPDEPPDGGYRAGDVAMANSGPGTSGSQFFLVVSEAGAETLNASGPPYRYSILGTMDAAGLEVAQLINTFGSSDEAGTPTKGITINGVTVGTGRPPRSPAGTTTTPAP